jgi:hypothetical protein
MSEGSIIDKTDYRLRHKRFEIILLLMENKLNHLLVGALLRAIGTYQ